MVIELAAPDPIDKGEPTTAADEDRLPAAVLAVAHADLVSEEADLYASTVTGATRALDPPDGTDA
jgi:hypothetical protein